MKRQNDRRLPETIFISSTNVGSFTICTAYEVSWLLSVIFDSFAFILILVKTVQMRRVYQFQGSYGSLANLFLRDGE